MPSLIAFATHWGSKYGGINSFNTDFLTAFGNAYPNNVQVICMVIDANDDEIAQAKKNNVVLVKLPYLPQGKVFTDKHAEAAIAELTNQSIQFDPKNTVWLGHDRISGEAAITAAKKGGRSALIHHMSYDSYEAFAEDSQSAKSKTEIQKSLFTQADLVLAVGSFLHRALADMLDKPKEEIHLIIPGLANIEPRKTTPSIFTAFLSGRLSNDAAKIKQGYLGVAGFAMSIANANKQNTPNNLVRNPKLLLRGVDFESCQNYSQNPSINSINTETELQEFAEKYATGRINLHTLPFTQDRDELYDDLKSASVALMPSWHEGFGLVAWEAIAAGVPLIISKGSGVYEFLDDLFKTNLVEAIKVDGSSQHPFFNDKDLDEVAKAITRIAQEPEKFRKRAMELRDQLSVYTWEDCVEKVANYFAWEVKKNTITTDMVIAPTNTPENLQESFKKQKFEQNLDLHPTAQQALAIANLIGGWDEKNQADIEIISPLLDEDYDNWVKKIREILILPNSPITFENGQQWKITERKQLFDLLGDRLFDEHLTNFKNCAVTVLKEHDPKFELSVDKRYAAGIYEKILRYSPNLRKSIAEGLALIGNHPDNLKNCSPNCRDGIATLTIREIFENADWLLWGSINNVLPILAEAAPKEFLNIVEKSLKQSICPFDELFQQESDGFAGENYLTGLLWALETLAWEEIFLVRVCSILGELAMHDPGGKWSNRPANSLTTILLPWCPRTMASVKKRKTVLRILKRDFPTVAWILLLSLLPNQHSISFGTRKPSWRNSISNNFEKDVDSDEYFDQISFYAELAVEMANNNVPKLAELIAHLNNLTNPAFEQFLEHLRSETICNLPENERLPLWTKLKKFVAKHKRFSNAEWSLNSDLVLEIENVITKLAPHNPLNLHCSLFDNHYLDSYEENNDFETQQQKIENIRQQAVQEVFNFGNMEAIFNFVESVSKPRLVGYYFSVIADEKIDSILLPSFLNDFDNGKISQFLNGYILNKQNKYGWEWADNFDKSNWSISQIAQFLNYLPFSENTWIRVSKWLKNHEKEYWTTTNADPYRSEKDCDLSIAVERLIEFSRFHEAIDCLCKMRHENRFDNARTIKALLLSINSINSTKISHQIDAIHITELIEALQNDENTNSDDLFKVEWAYLSLLDQYHGLSPKLLANRLGSDPEFFCELIRRIYYSKNECESNQNFTSQQEKNIVSNGRDLLEKWKKPPGMQQDNSFCGDKFIQWFEYVKKSCIESGHLDSALWHIGRVLFYAPPDIDTELWINEIAANALNAEDTEKMRNGFRNEAFNSRGVHVIDPTGKPELNLAEKYKQKADDVENHGFQRFATTLRNLSETYEHEAKQIIAQYKNFTITQTGE